MSISNKTEIERIVHARGKKVSRKFYGWFESQCEKLVEIAIQGSSTKGTVMVDDAKNLLHAMGKDL